MFESTIFVTPLERLDYFHSLPVLGEIPPEQMAAIAGYAQERHYRRGEFLLREGTPVDAIHLVVEGRIEVYREGVAIRSFGPRDSVGAFALLAQSPLGVDAVTRSPTTTLRLPASVVADALEEHFSALRVVLGGVARTLLDERSLLGADAGFRTRRPGEGSCPTRPLDLVERMVFLGRALPFSRSSLDGLTGLAKGVTELRLGAGSPLWNEGDDAGHALLVVCGGVQASRDAGRQAFHLGEGGAVGMVDMLAGRPRWFDARVDRGLVALAVEREALLDVFEDHFPMAESCLGVLAGEVLELFEHVASRGEERRSM